MFDASQSSIPSPSSSRVVTSPDDLVKPISSISIDSSSSSTHTKDAHASSSSTSTDREEISRNAMSVNNDNHLAGPETDTADANVVDTSIIPLTVVSKEQEKVELVYRPFDSSLLDQDMGDIIRLCDQELSEPYNLYTFRYFLDDWPHLTFMVFAPTDFSRAIGTIVCKQDMHRGKTNRGYIGMLSVDKAWRRRGIALSLVKRAMAVMVQEGADEIVIETEYDNSASLSLYERLGFIREKRLHRFYSNGKDAFRLILPMPKAEKGRGSETSASLRGREDEGGLGTRRDRLQGIPEDDDHDGAARSSAGLSWGDLYTEPTAE